MATDVSTLKSPQAEASPISHDPLLAGARKLARVMDHHHLDPIMGLIMPGVGDILGGLLGLYILGVAAARHVPRLTLARMVLNLATSVSIGAIPILGDAFDFYFRASTRNLALLERPGPPSRNAWFDGGVLVLAGLALLAAMCAPIALLVWAIMRYRAGGF